MISVVALRRLHLLFARVQRDVKGTEDRLSGPSWVWVIIALVLSM